MSRWFRHVFASRSSRDNKPPPRRATEEISHRMQEKVGLHAAERALESVERSGERLLERAAERGGERSQRYVVLLWLTFLFRRIWTRVLFRSVRGASIALPLVGCVFASLLATQDWRRAQQEWSCGAARRAFLLALSCDSADVLVHCMIAGGMVWPEMRMPLEMEASLVLAVISTVSAVTGEVLARRKV